MQEVLLGDCLEVMKTFPDNYFSAVVTDPPYGLSFMGKGWDHAVPDRAYWEQCFRITKPGSFLISMGGTRTFHRLACAIEDAGWEIRDCISYLYGSGFPKSHNHFGIEGFGTALKPAWEPCILAMKLLDGTFAQNAEKWGQAGINIDGCRVPSSDVSGWSISGSKESENTSMSGKNYARYPKPDNPKGRWPANVILNSEAGAMLDEQSRVSKTTSRIKRPNASSREIYGKYNSQPHLISGHSDTGGASRFFYCAKASSRERNEGLEELPTKQTIGGGGTNNTEDDVCGKYGSIKAPQKNHHPTVKPLALMEYLIKLVMPPSEGILLDPFVGSGSTLVAAKRLGFSAVGIEKQPEYVEIAKARIESASVRQESDQMDLFGENEHLQ